MGRQSSPVGGSDVRAERHPAGEPLALSWPPHTGDPSVHVAYRSSTRRRACDPTASPRIWFTVRSDSCPRARPSRSSRPRPRRELRGQSVACVMPACSALDVQAQHLVPLIPPPGSPRPSRPPDIVRGGRAAQVRRVWSPSSATRSTARISSPAASSWPRCSRSIDPAQTVAIGLAMPLPAMSGRRAVDRLEQAREACRVGSMLADGARPSEPMSAAPRSVRMSPNRLLATMVSTRSGWRTMSAASASTWMLRTVTSG